MSNQHWFLETDANNVAWLSFDKANTGTNVLSQEVMQELHERLNELQTNKPKALIIRSAKNSGFIAGADITEFETMQSPDAAFEMVRQGQQIMDQIEDLPFPTVAMINGFALGGGLELALACDYRVMTNDTKAVLGFPEVKLGLNPGFGGTVRSTQLIGATNAMDMMLTGRNIRPKAAKRMGLVDQIVPTRHLEKAAEMLALNPPKKSSRSLKLKAMDSFPVRKVLAKVLRKQVAKKAKKDHYPAPYRMIDLWEQFGHDPEEMMVQEARAISELMCTPTSRNLVRVFGLQNKLKGAGGKTKHTFKHVHVIGAGVMGGDIAAWCAYRGMTVSLQDREAKYIAPALERARKLFLKKTRSAEKASLIMDRLIPDVEGESVVRADVVIEAIYENAQAKRDLYASLEPKMKPGAVLATNTSSIELTEIAKDLQDPNRLIGLHFFNPVAMMPLVEVIGTETTNKQDLEKGMAFTRRIDRLPLACKSAPGFVVNRVLTPYTTEAFFIAKEGVPLIAIDKAATDFGMPMGPIELADTVGLDVSAHVGKILSEAYDLDIPDGIEEMLEKKHLGKKTGQGFYTWDKKGKPIKPKAENYTPPSDLAERMIYRYLNEAVAVLRDGIVSDADLLDAGMIFGTGFAPFLGGPINYIRQHGANKIVNRLKEFEAKYGKRFALDAGWEKFITSGAIEHDDENE
ncbi:MAG: crotonase [Gammaproteobacteria bacterium]|nr:enoyl-CoA hydratase/isomerase family protein [Gammaproteobacteria bacterium]NNC97357.1 crotonase [Gammaproteobacteria bacterium]NNM13124.1 crotonase [Gammaproteobacteria bacterium]